MDTKQSQPGKPSNPASEWVLPRCPADSEYPYIREASYERKLKRWNKEGRNAPLPEHAVHAQPDVSVLKSAEVSALLDRAELTPIQRECVELVLCGYRVVEIARLRKCSKQAVMMHLRRAMRKLERAVECNPMHGLAECYQEWTR